jgi:hypothetical protein
MGDFFLFVRTVMMPLQDQAFLRSYDSAPCSPLPPLPVVKLSLFLSLPVYRRSSLLTGEGEGMGVGEEPNYTTARSLTHYKLFNTLSFLFICSMFVNVKKISSFLKLSQLLVLISDERCFSVPVILYICTSTFCKKTDRKKTD